MPTIIIFDQLLFWKASEIVNAIPDDNPIRNVVSLLGSFHTFMNLLGAIGTLMDGSGLKAIQDRVTGENDTIHDERNCSAASISWAPAGGSVAYMSECG